MALIINKETKINNTLSKSISTETSLFVKKFKVVFFVKVNSKRISKRSTDVSNPGPPVPIFIHCCPDLHPHPQLGFKADYGEVGFYLCNGSRVSPWDGSKAKWWRILCAVLGKEQVPLLEVESHPHKHCYSKRFTDLHGWTNI